MSLPPVTDGTIQLRPFSSDDGGEAVTWIAGPMSRARSATDGGPVFDEAGAKRLVEELTSDNAYTIFIDEASCGWVSLLSDGKQCGHIQVILAHPRLWLQGIGGRVVRLMQTVAFEHLGYEALAVSEVPESAESARVSLEDAGFAMIERRLKERHGEERVVVDYFLDALSHRSAEQRIFLVHHGRSEPEAADLVVGLQDDPPLDYLGRAQAESLSLSGLLYATAECICSPSKRAKATAEQAFAAHEVPIALSEHWQDRDWGSYSGQVSMEIPRTETGLLVDPPQGESDEAMRHRLQQALNELPFGGHLAVVTHGVNIAALLRHLRPQLAAAGGLGSGVGIAHGSISELRRGPSGWRIIRIGDDRHQQGRRATAESA